MFLIGRADEFGTVVRVGRILPHIFSVSHKPAAGIAYNYL